ncbi:MAG: prolyl oligopeptidase family serine peptidase [Clostridia bacterium]|nr:prolyl oligopeptidase family serine peptidase [Clostridia bacterium]
MEQKEILVKSTLDSSMQPSLFYKSETNEKRPLLVGLHTWSHDRFNQINNMLPYARKYDFNLLLPEFRGNNLETNPICTQACGSDYAKQDIKDAIDYVIDKENVDNENIFLLGLSGGGHMSLLMAGFCPEYFKAIGAYVPITDLEKWTKQNKNYCEHVLACCSNNVDEMKKRSPLSYVENIAKANLKIFHGKFDPVVPVSHSLELYEEIMSKHPNARIFLDVFDGGHEIDMETAFYWIISQYKGVKKAKVTG